MNQVRKELFGAKDWIDLAKYVRPGQNNPDLCYKIRVVYAREVEQVTWEIYYPKKIDFLKIVRENQVEYSYKYLNRSIFDMLLRQKGSCDDILILKNNRVTDCSFANLAFYDGFHWYTPKEPLLKGTCRERLIETGKIKELDIEEKDLKEFKECALINAMLDLGEKKIPIQNII